jgi:hypothetical protein
MGWVFKVAISVRLLLIVFFILVSLAAIEVTLTALIETLGIAALLITYSLSGVIADIFHGMRIQYKQNIELYDWVEATAGYVNVIGIVIEFDICMMCIQTVEGPVKWVSYSAFLSSCFTNFSRKPSTYISSPAALVPPPAVLARFPAPLPTPGDIPPTAKARFGGGSAETTVDDDDGRAVVGTRSPVPYGELMVMALVQVPMPLRYRGPLRASGRGRQQDWMF